MRLALAAVALLCCACEVKLNRGPHLPNAPGEDAARPHGGIEIAAKDPPKSRLPLPPPPVKYTEDKLDSSDFMMDPGDRAVPPEVRRLGPEAVAAYLDAPAAAEPAKRGDPKQLYLRAYQLKGMSPDEAIALFKQVIALVPAEDEYHDKAMTQLARLGLPLICAGSDPRGDFVVNTTDLANARANLVNWPYDVLRQADGTFTIVICSQRR